MRIGVSVGNMDPSWGGAYTFERSIVEASQVIEQIHGPVAGQDLS